MRTAPKIISIIAGTAVIGGFAHAGSMTATPIRIDRSTLLPGVPVALPDVTIQFLAELRSSDEIRITVEGAMADTVGPWPPSPVCTLPPEFGYWDPSSPLNIAIAGRFGSGWSFRPTSPYSLPYGTTCSFKGLTITPESIAQSCEVAARYSVSFYGSAFDSGGPVIVATVEPCSPPGRDVAIDVRPGTMPNSVNVESNGNIPVAILSELTFYAPGQIAGGSLTFGRAGDEASLLKCNPTAEDVNVDGLLDLVCHFSTQTAGFQSGDTQGVLMGETVGGEKIRGTDSVRTVR